MRALVTGGAGFIGSHITDRLLADGAEVRVVDDLSSGRQGDVDPAAELVVGSITDEILVEKCMDGVDTVFHQAAHRAVLQSVEHPLQTDLANVHGTVTVLTCARDAGVRRVVYASSSSVYGNATVFPTREDALPSPRSPYAVSKLAAESYCCVYWDLFGLETVSLRYFNVYGPRQRPDSAYAAVIPLFVGALTTGVPPEVHGDGLQARSFTYIDDVVEANILAASRPADACAGKVFNIAGGITHTVLEVLGTIQEILGTSIQPLHTDSRSGDIRHSEADISLAREVLGYFPHFSLVQGLTRTVEWFR